MEKLLYSLNLQRTSYKNLSNRLWVSYGKKVLSSRRH